MGVFFYYGNIKGFVDLNLFVSGIYKICKMNKLRWFDSKLSMRLKRKRLIFININKF